MVEQENVLTHNIGTGAIRGSFSGRNERPQPQFGPTLHRPDLRVGLRGPPRQRSDLEAALIRCPAGHAGLVLVTGEAGRARSDWSARC